jgi:C_GCAxxG_C_C family probable redox protein
MTDPIQVAGERFAQGFNCSQAVFSALASRSGLSDELALRIASPLGGGVARQGQVCGAVTGALMALGLQRGSDTAEAKEDTYRLAEEFIRRFQELHGTILCRELIGYDISTKEGLQAAREKKAFTGICPRLVEDATRLAAEFLAE